VAGDPGDCGMACPKGDGVALYSLGANTICRHSTHDVFARESVYMPAYSDVWCEGARTNMIDNFGNAPLAPGACTQRGCQALCDFSPSCQFYLYGWMEHSDGFDRCATFHSCNNRSHYSQGSPIIYQKVNVTYNKRFAPLSPFSATREDCLDLCKKEPSCTGVQWYAGLEPGGYARCDMFAEPICDVELVDQPGCTKVTKMATPSPATTTTNNGCQSLCTVSPANLNVTLPDGEREEKLTCVGAMMAFIDPSAPAAHGEQIYESCQRAHSKMRTTCPACWNCDMEETNCIPRTPQPGAGAAEAAECLGTAQFECFKKCGR